MANDTYDIQELVTETGVPRRTIYFYVQQGVLPPPQGAGLAAYYSEDHLLRLKLIPVLRGQGLRLVEIREQFTRMDTQEMRSKLETARAAQEAAQKAPKPADRLPGTTRSIHPPAPTGIGPGWDAPAEAERHLHYRLPGGITLSVPESLSITERQRVNLLIQAAKQIFSGAFPTIASLLNQPPGNSAEHPGNGVDTSDSDPTNPGD
jgi:DNA-binding transcriptional MerR regulator